MIILLICIAAGILYFSKSDSISGLAKGALAGVGLWAGAILFLLVIMGICLCMVFYTDVIIGIGKGILALLGVWVIVALLKIKSA